MAFEISEAGIAAARIGARAELDFRAAEARRTLGLAAQENVLDAGRVGAWPCAPRGATQTARKRRDVALILPDFCTRIAVLDFDDFPSDPKEQRRWCVSA